MRPFRLVSLAFVLQVVAACVTINVYFPAVAAEKAADRIIEDVWGPRPEAGGSSGEPEAPEGEAPQSGRAPGTAPGTALAARLLDALVPAAHAAEPNIDISSPAIKRITGSMEQRHGQLKPYYEAGAIGLTPDALVEVRDLNAVPLPKRGQLRQLVDAENRDRNALYREIAKANGHPEWEDEIRDVFARRWIDKAPGGWYYRNDGGKWTRK